MKTTTQAEAKANEAWQKLPLTELADSYTLIRAPVDSSPTVFLQTGLNPGEPERKESNRSGTTDGIRIHPW